MPVPWRIALLRTPRPSQRWSARSPRTAAWPRTCVLDAEVSEDGEVAIVLLELNPGPDPYPMLSLCEPGEEGWRELVMSEAGGAGPWWVVDRWASVASGTAPAGATRVVARRGEVTKRRPVVAGLYVVVFWSPAGGEEDEPPEAPEVLGFE
jgi:hypothetical protein